MKGRTYTITPNEAGNYTLSDGTLNYSGDQTGIIFVNGINYRISYQAAADSYELIRLFDSVPAARAVQAGGRIYLVTRDFAIFLRMAC